MMLKGRSARFALVSRAMAAAFAVGACGGVAVSPALAKAAAPSYSPDFLKVAGPLQEALGKAQGKPVDPAAADKLKAQLDASFAAVKGPDDKMVAGGFAIQLGQLLGDQMLLRKGVLAEIDSGKAPAEMMPKLYNYAGQFALQANDAAGALTYFGQAIAAGYAGVDAYVNTAAAQMQLGKVADGLASLRTAVEHNQAAHQAVPKTWLTQGAVNAYKAQLTEQAGYFVVELVKAYPEKDNWNLAIAVVRDAAQRPNPEILDLMRLMARTNSFAEERDYLEYIQSADARLNPGEVKIAIDMGLASGMLKPTNGMVTEAQRISSARIAADQAVLPELDKDARLPTAKVATITGAADAFLSYGQPAKAAELYRLALDKPGADLATINTRLGIALIDAGDYAGAQASLAKVDGSRKAIAQLWDAYAAGKAASK